MSSWDRRKILMLGVNVVIIVGLLLVKTVFATSIRTIFPTAMTGAAITVPQLIGIIILLLFIVYTFLGFNPFGLTEPLVIGTIVGLY